MSSQQRKEFMPNHQPRNMDRTPSAETHAWFHQGKGIFTDVLRMSRANHQTSDKTRRNQKQQDKPKVST